MDRVRTISDLKVFIADNIRHRRGEVAEIYSSDAEREDMEQQLRVLESAARMPGAIFNYAKWYSMNSELIILENILWKLKTIERHLCEVKTMQSQSPKGK